MLYTVTATFRVESRRPTADQHVIVNLLRDPRIKAFMVDRGVPSKEFDPAAPRSKF